jgi:putative restriction endonuclease
VNVGVCYPGFMAKAVFIASSHATYQDRPGEVYHFPNSYLKRVAHTVGDWVIFFEGRRGGSRGYYAVQRVSHIIADPSDSTHSFAILDRASALSFEQNVPRLRDDGMPYETGLPIVRGSNTSSVRIISDADFAAIVGQGLKEVAAPDALPRTGPLPSSYQVEEEATPFLGAPQDVARQLVPSNRLFREATFARQVKRAYQARCAMSGLELRNGGGRPEVEAAHIKPVSEMGPDVVSNGLALSGTLHWLFDRGLLSVGEQGDILLAKDSIAPEVASRLLMPDHRLLVPTDATLRPHPAFLKWHRENRFKG